MRLRKAGGGIAHKAQALHRTVAIFKRHRQIVGAAGRGHLVQHLMVALGIEPLQAPAEGLAPLDDVLEGLFHIAKADDHLHPREEQFLAGVAKRFGMTDTEFAYIKARHVIAAKRNPYDVLGLKPSTTNDELKSHYRRLVADNHPDKLIARGVPKEFVVIATEKVAAINEAYDQIARERGM